MKSVPSSFFQHGTTVWNNYFFATLKFLIHKKTITLKRHSHMYITPVFWNAKTSIFRAIITKNMVYSKTVIWFANWQINSVLVKYFSDLLFLTLGRYFNLSERFFQLVFNLFAGSVHILYLCRWKCKKWKTCILMCFPIS